MRERYWGAGALRRQDMRTAIAEIRPWIGAPVSLATLRLEHPVRLVDFSPRRGRKSTKGTPTTGVLAKGVSQRELDEILDTIGTAMARPIDPAESQVSYVPTQYVSEVVRRAGYDGVMFKSAVGPGVNVVLFDKTNARVERVELHRATSVSYKAEVVAPPPPPAPAFDSDGARLSLDNLLVSTHGEHPDFLPF